MPDPILRPGLSRRAMLAGAAALGVAALPAVARADERAVIGTWGGDYANLLQKHIDTPLLAPQGVQMVQDIGDEPERVAQVVAQRMLPRGMMDVVCVEAPFAYRLQALNLLEPLDETKVPNLKYARAGLGSSVFVPHIYSPQVLIYNPQTVKAPPASFADLLAPRFKGRVGFPTNNAFFVMMMASLYASGTVDDVNKAETLLLQLNKNGLRLYPETDSIATAFKSGEIDAGVMWMARVVMWQNAGISVAASFPKGGAVIYVSGFVVPKNAPNKAAAYAFLNAALAPSAQQGFAADMGYLPTVTNAPLTGKIAAQLAMPSPPPRLVTPDYAFDAKATAPFQSWWQSKVQQG